MKIGILLEVPRKGICEKDLSCLNFFQLLLHHFNLISQHILFV
ncbi:hypothetical protein SAMN04487911_106106 [Arenibacter nanhaiticus]|uniref:Uncharacterized protein n=1 Tax=Arenibacter nanhaiticus TaxID=558155 RepID=A0A1M6ECE3_9FLAO|nr:hypothetical protein SAMN04487911_106106 [Arenibacter nanhaiticus]